MPTTTKHQYGRIIAALALAPLFSIALGAMPAAADCACLGKTQSIGCTTDQAACTSQCPAGETCTCTPDAAACPGGTPAGSKTYALENPLGSDITIPTLVGRVIKIFTGVSGSLALLMFIYGGMLWIFSGGSQERVTKGKEVMKWAIIGMVVMFSAYGLVNLVFKGLGAASAPAVKVK